MPEPNGRPVYVSELIDLETRLMARLDRLEDNANRRLDAIDAKLDAKADSDGVRALAHRVDTIESALDRWSLPRKGLGALALAVISATVGAAFASLRGWLGGGPK